MYEPQTIDIRSQLAPTRRAKQLMLALVTVLVLGVSIGLGPGSEAIGSPSGPIPIGNEGPWMNGVTEYSCANSTVCAEWPNYDTNSATVCCVDPGVLGTYQPLTNSTCYTNLGQRAF